MRGPRLSLKTSKKTKEKGRLHVLGCPVFTENIGEDQILPGPRLPSA